MSTLIGLLRVGASSLATQQAGAAVHGNNVANAQTPGYSRRELIVDEGRGGSGSVTSAVGRAEDFVLSQQLAHQQGELSFLSRNAAGLSSIEQIFQSGQSNLSARVAELAQSFSQLTAAPGDLVRRADVVERGRAVTLEFNRVGGQLQNLRAGSATSARELVPAINDAAQQLAALNRQALAGPPGSQPPSVTGADNRVLDQRDALAQRLADLAGGKVLRNSDGTLDVLVGGLSLVHGATAQRLELRDDPAGGLYLTVGDQRVPAADQSNQGKPSQLGQLGGALASYTAAGDTLAQFDRLAFDLSSAINAQHAFGVGLDGNGGRPFFAPLAAQGGAAASLKLSADLSAQTVAAGFTAQPGDNRNASALANLIDQPVLEGGRSSFRNVYTRIVSSLGFGVQQAKSGQQIAEDQLQGLQAQREAVAGVATDEEMTRMLAYQRAFEASARFIQTVNEMLQKINEL